MKAIKFLFFGLMIFNIVSCTKKVDIEAEKKSVMNTDIEFSNLSIKTGYIESFLTYCAATGVMLQPNSLPVEGKNAIKDLLSKRSDKEFTLTWKPTFADVAASGEMAYTYGIWQIDAKDSIGNPKISKGTYVTIWKKDNEGKWKWVMDTGQDGIGDEK